MLFNSLQFAIFFALVFCLHRALPRSWRSGLLLTASLIFYTLWIPQYLFLLLLDVGINYWLLRGIAERTSPRRYLVTSIVFTLGILAGFKYLALLLGTALPSLQLVFGFQFELPEVFLPLGISFYSFQIIALAIDTYRERQLGEQSKAASVRVPGLARYALFISFFPQLIAGPILRGKELLPQLETAGSPSTARNRRGLWLLAGGLFKKIVLADFLLAPVVDRTFEAAGIGGPGFHWVALYSFSFQIYFDFSGYTDMARGIALLLGFELPMNFREPYLSRNPAEFWRRWHMTLSRWLRDYLYIPLGGNRKGSARTGINLLLTMLLGGLWHGAAWNFVIWGGLHGLLLGAHRIFAGPDRSSDLPLAWRDAPKVFLHFHAVVLLWVFFRAADYDQAIAFLGGLVNPADYLGWPIWESAVIALCFALHLCERWLRPRLPQLREKLAHNPASALIEGLALGAILGLALAVSGAGGEFIYFQF